MLYKVKQQTGLLQRTLSLHNRCIIQNKEKGYDPKMKAIIMLIPKLTWLILFEGDFFNWKEQKSAIRPEWKKKFDRQLWVVDAMKTLRMDGQKWWLGMEKEL